MGWVSVTLSIFGIVLGGGCIGGILGIGAYEGVKNKNASVKDATNYSIQFYISLVAYFILHMIFVISSDFVEAFNIPPLNIGIYVDKLAAIRALLMVIADIIEYWFLDKHLKDQGKAQKSLTSGEMSPRRIGSIVSFVVMLACRLAYLIIIYKSDNKSLSVFITLCIEGFWFGVFQMSFFAIGPKYNAATSLGIHTMGNFIFFLQLILNKMAKSRPQINSLYRVRVHAWICFVTSVLALVLWLVFCLYADAEDDLKKIAKQLKEAGVEFPPSKGWDAKPTDGTGLGPGDVWSPLLLFIVGAFAEDFAVPGILPFALLDTEKAALVNYLTPLFFMTGALITFFLNDIFGGEAGLTGSLNSYFKEWSANKGGGEAWHGLWALNVPKYVAFLIAMWSIHGTYGRLRCIVQSRWRVMLLTMFVVVPRAWLETAGYVGVANYAIGYFAVTGFDDGDWTGKEIRNTSGDMWKLCSMFDKDKIWHNELMDVKHNEHPQHKGHVKIPADSGKWYEMAGANSGMFMYIAIHDMIAMFCRFVYGKLAIKYNTTIGYHIERYISGIKNIKRDIQLGDEVSNTMYICVIDSYFK